MTHHWRIISFQNWISTENHVHCTTDTDTPSVLYRLERNSCITHCFIIVYFYCVLLLHLLRVWLFTLLLLKNYFSSLINTGCDIQGNYRKRVTGCTELHQQTPGKQVSKAICIAPTATKHMAYTFCSVATAPLVDTPSLPLTEADWFASDANFNWRSGAVTMQLRQQKEICFRQ